MHRNTEPDLHMPTPLSDTERSTTVSLGVPEAEGLTPLPMAMVMTGPAVAAEGAGVVVVVP